MNNRSENIIFGRHPVSAFLERKLSDVEKIWLLTNIKCPEKLRNQIRMAQKSGAVVQYVDRKTLDRLTDGAVHQGVVIRIASCRIWQFQEWSASLDPLSPHSVVIILDGIQDPRNLGAIFRSAAAADVDGVIFPNRKNSPLSAVAMKTSAGALDQIPAIRIANISNTLHAIKDMGYWLIGISEKSEKKLYEDVIPARVAFLFGGEDRGIRQINIDICDELRMIPMTGPAGSLNVSAAAAIVLYEYIRGLGCAASKSQNNS